ncbi:MAG: cation/H(+) antiporter [Verrucomicrobia bacterium]|nr:cation/H(+) antiporter [Verrucomicrobiota bacterium]
MHGIELVQDLALVMASAAVATVICQKLRQPVVLGYILAGMLIGPNTPPFSFVTNENEIKTLADLGVVLLMFSVGLHFSFRKLREVGLVAVVAAVIEIVGMFFLGKQMGHFFGWGNMEGVFLGATLAISSTTIIAKTLEGLGLLRQGFSQVVFGILIVEDILAIALMGILTSLGTTGGAGWYVTAGTLVKLAAFFVTVAVGGFLLVPRLIRMAGQTRMDEVLLVTVLGLVFGLALFAQKIGFSVALGAFLMGAVLAEVKEVHRIERLAAPVRDLFSAIFFTSSGMLMKFDLLPHEIGQLAAITLAVVLGKPLFTTFGALLGGCDLKGAIRSGLSLGQIGEFSFIISTLGITMGVVSSRIYSLTVMVAAITTLTTPYLVQVSAPLGDWVEHRGPRSWLQFWRTYHAWFRSLQGSRGDKHHAARLFVRRLMGQLAIQLALITAPFLGAAGLWRTYHGRMPEGIRTLGWMELAYWMGAMILALPILVAWIRKYHALVVLLSELAFPRPLAEGSVESARRLTLVVFSAAGYSLLVFYLLLISSPLLPSIHILLVAVGFTFVAFLIMRRRLVRLYASGQAAIRETWESVPTQDSIRLPGNAEVRAYQVREDSSWVGRRLIDTGLRAQTGAVVVAIERGGKSLVSPGPDEVIRTGDQLFVFGEDTQMQSANQLLGQAGITSL